MGRDDEWKRAAARRFLACAAMLAVGLVLAIVGGGLLVLGVGLVTVALVLAMCLVFLEVGYGEDRARAREERAAAPPRPRRPRRPDSFRPRRQ